MNFKTNRILIISLLFILLLTGISAISAADTVSADGSLNLADIDSNIDNDNGLAAVDEEILSDDENLENETIMNFNDLNNEIRHNSKITLESDVKYNSDDYITDGILIADDTVIDGKNHKIDAKSKTRIFKVATGYTLTLKNINIINGHMSGEVGGAILNSGTIILNNCNFTNCKVDGSKSNGGVISGSGLGTISNCNFIECSAPNMGGAVMNNKLTFKYCNFDKCSAGYMGGAVFGNDNKFYNCNFNQDTAGFGGAIGGTAYLYYSNFVNCKSTTSSSYDGGGAGSGEFPVVESCTFTNCKATKGYGGALRGTSNSYNSKFVNCVSKQGGAIRGKGETVSCTFINCVASTNMGGAIFTEKATIKKCTFTGCSASKSNGGAVYLGNNVNVVNCKFTNCTAPNGCGGAVYGNGVVNKCTFEQNQAKFGGAVSSYSLTVKSSTFTNNKATKGGAAYNVKSLTSCQFDKNSASYGGAVYNAQKVVSSTFNNNKAKYGALSYNDVNVVFNKVTVKNTIKLTQGIFYNNKHKLTLTNSKIVNKGKFSKYINYNTGVFIYNKNTLKSSYKVKQIAGPRNVQKK